MQSEVDQIKADEENQFHSYVGNRIPWYVRLIWIGFWCFAVYYTVRYLFPDLQTELLHAP
ncbi:MAG TPA: hypothetical protein VHC19_16390 [Pirellulales bacterium]|jgi:hypothetical protein|nr:hypothetical protein [Pirellulales bacterium]